MKKTEAILTQAVEQLERLNEALAVLRRELLPGTVVLRRRSHSSCDDAWLAASQARASARKPSVRVSGSGMAIVS